MQLQPILVALRRHKVTTTLLVLQVAFTCAIVCNAVFLIARRVEWITLPSGLDENSLSIVRIDDLQPGKNPLSLHQGDLAALRELPGVESAAIVSNVPMSGNNWVTVACGSLAASHAFTAAMAAHSIARMTDVRGCANPDEFTGGPETLGTFGLKLVAGRDFNPDEYVQGKPPESSGHTSPPAAIVSEALAQRLFPSHPGQVVGRTLYFGLAGVVHGEPTRVTGVVARLQRGHLNRDSHHGFSSNGLAILAPIEPGGGDATFALRSRPPDRARVIKAALATLAKRKPDRQISAGDGKTYTQIRATYFSRGTTMIRMLLAAVLGLLFVTAVGIAGLEGFWVQQRTRSIGIRRALGATRRDILRYFQTENFLIVTIGVVLGVILAVVLNLVLMAHYQLPRFPLWYLAVGAAVLWMLGQLAVLMPALRASNVPPVEATRSV
ncbi:MAG: ABC transporter permease [Rhodanobacteraceae bacterium]